MSSPEPPAGTVRARHGDDYDLRVYRDGSLRVLKRFEGRDGTVEQALTRDLARPDARVVVDLLASELEVEIDD